MARVIEPPRSRSRKAAFVAMTVVVVYGVVEACAAIVFWASSGRWFSFDEAARARHALVAGRSPDAEPVAGPGSGWEGEVIHPYLGYVVDPTHPQWRGVDLHGFDTPEPIMQLPSDERFVVGIFGGSVAIGVSQFGRRNIADAIRDTEPVAGREVVFVNLATGGYKQPQQALALTYVLSMGGHLDAVVNVDGFNDLVLPSYENYASGTALHYPRGWQWRTENLADEAALVAAGRVLAYEDARRRLASRMEQSVLRYTVSGTVVWSFVDRSLSTGQSDARAASERAAAGERSYLRHGPPIFAVDSEQVVQRSVDLWVLGSLHMHAVCAGAAIPYVHALQPNQYVPGSKPLSDEERRTAFEDRVGYGPIAIRHYDRLVRAGSRLREAGVSFHDLTGAFADHEETIYIDECCHVTPRGYAIIGRLLGEALRGRLDEAAAAPPAR